MAAKNVELENLVNAYVKSVVQAATRPNSDWLHFKEEISMSDSDLLATLYKTKYGSQGADHAFRSAVFARPELVNLNVVQEMP